MHLKAQTMLLSQVPWADLEPLGCEAIRSSILPPLTAWATALSAERREEAPEWMDAVATVLKVLYLSNSTLEIDCLPGTFLCCTPSLLK